MNWDLAVMIGQQPEVALLTSWQGQVHQIWFHSNTSTKGI